MSDDPIPFRESDAWIFLAVADAAAGDPAPLDRIVAVADAINHAIPTERELEGGFTRLLRADLIRQVERDLGLTAAGAALAARGKAASEAWLEQWEFLTGVLETETFAGRRDVAYALEPGEAESAYRAYREWFRKTLEQIEADEADDGS
jgi:hypothetical protein